VPRRRAILGILFVLDVHHPIERALQRDPLADDGMAGVGDQLVLDGLAPAFDDNDVSADGHLLSALLRSCYRVLAEIVAPWSEYLQLGYGTTRRISSSGRAVETWAVER
jgi:hypothetical protein